MAVAPTPTLRRAHGDAPAQREHGPEHAPVRSVQPRRRRHTAHNRRPPCGERQRAARCRLPRNPALRRRTGDSTGPSSFRAGSGSHVSRDPASSPLSERTTRRSAGVDRSFSTKPAVSGGRLDPRPLLPRTNGSSLDRAAGHGRRATASATCGNAVSAEHGEVVRLGAGSCKSGCRSPQLAPHAPQRRSIVGKPHDVDDVEAVACVELLASWGRKVVFLLAWHADRSWTHARGRRSGWVRERGCTARGTPRAKPCTLARSRTDLVSAAPA
jgi:hypothetical protein